MFVSFYLIFIYFSFLQQNVNSGYIETVTISGCESCRLYLTCRHLSSIIAILEANFQQNELTLNDTNSTVSPLITWTPFPPIHPRQALNKRCSGINHCSFVLTEDCPGADEWGPGTLHVKYACISEDRIRTFCNSEIVLPSQRDLHVFDGFIHNPGYPRFYASQRECRWKISTSNQQQLRITILDISITGDIPLFPDGCSDHLQVFDSAQLVHSTCQLEEPPLEILSQTDNVEVVLKSTHSLTPRRGILIYYTAVGCLTPEAPEDGYLVYRNETAAEFRCCVGFVFPDDGKRQRIITCLGATWDVELPLPNCQRRASLPIGTVISRRPVKIEMSSDILAPALLIVALFAINCGVVFYIYKKRKQQTIQYEAEELGNLRSKPNKDQTLP